MKPIKCISTGLLSGILMISNMGIHAESADSLWVSELSAQQIIIDRTVHNTSDTIVSIIDNIEIDKQPDVVEYTSQPSYVQAAEPVVTYVENPVENVITYEQFMQMYDQLQTETVDQSGAAQANYDAALAAYNEALAQYDAAHLALTAAGVPVTVVEQVEDEEGNIIEVTREEIPDTSNEQAALESASLNLINAEANLNAASEALNGAEQSVPANVPQEDSTVEPILEEETEIIEINQEVTEQTETTQAETVTGTTSSGLKYESTDGSTATITGYTQTITNLVIPEQVDGYTVTGIGKSAFEGCSTIQSISLPGSITVIDSYAFRKCTRITELTLPEGLTTLGAGAFWECAKLNSVTFPTSLTEALRPFSRGCTELIRVVLPEGLTAVPAYMFDGNSFIQEVVLPSTIQKIGMESFYDCTGITSIKFPSELKEIGSHAFKGCTGLTKVVLPEGFTTLGGGAFINCTTLNSVTFPTSLTEALRPFGGCTKLIRVVLPEGLTTVPAYMFDGNTCIQEVVLPSTIQKIGWGSFESCTGIKSITLPSGLTEIGNYSFRGCTGLTKVVLPEGLTTLGAGAFINCTTLNSVTFPTSLTEALRPFGGCTKLIRVVLPEGLTAVPANMFDGNTSIQEVVLPSTIQKIGYGSFYGCTGIKFISIPGNVTYIDRYAFRGCTGLTTVILPESLITLEMSVFADCTNLQNIVCPTSLRTISKNSFGDTTNLTLISDYNCYTTMFAIRNDISFKVLKGRKDDENCVLDWSGSELQVYYDAMSINGYIPVKVAYKIKDSWFDKISDLKLDMYLPSQVEIDYDSLKISNSEVEEYSFSNRNLIIPVQKQEDQLSFLMKVKEQGRLLGYFSISMLKEGTSTYEVIDLINEKTHDFLTINVPDYLNSTSVTIDGLAPSSSEVNIYVNDELYTTVSALKTGEWNANLELTPTWTYEVFRLKAAINDTEAVEKKVIYYVDSVNITGMTIQYNHDSWYEEVDLLDTTKKKPTVYFVPGSKIDFELTFDKPETIDKVYVTSTRDNVKKYLEAVYDPATGKYKTDGYFDSTNEKYIPGNISYEYIPKHKEFLVNPNMDMAGVVITDIFDNNIVITKDTDTETEATLDLTEFTQDAAKSMLKYSFKLFDSIENLEFKTSDFYSLFMEDSETVLKYMLPGENGKSYLMSLDYSNPSTYSMLIQDLTDNTVVGTVLDYLSDDGNNLGWQNASDLVSNITKANGLIYKYLKITDESNDLREEVLSNGNFESQEELESTLKKVDELENDKKAFLLITVGVPLIMGLGVGVSAMTGPALVLSGMISAISLIAPIFWNYRTAQIKGQRYKIRFMLDPSGYVYDIDTNKRLEDVKTTAYWIEYDESEGFWDNMPADTEYGILWDASEYNIENPLFTDKDGKYGWDVPEGWWRVKYEKEDYITTWSDWMPVPPIQTEVNIGMKSKSMPFTDVPGDAWYYDVAKECYKTGLINGTSATTFSPLQTMTRAMVVTILWRMDGQPKTAFNDKFKDVSSTQWYATSISWAEKAGVVHGYGDGTFKPDAAVTREQVAVMLANYATYKKVYVPGTKKLNTYPDGSQVSTWAQQGMKWALTNGIVSGDGAGYLRPKKSAARAEGAAMLLRMNNWL